MRVDLDHGRGEQPLYVQLANAIQDFITLERLKPGDALPSENVLATENRLSRATVIKAFDTLVDRGVVTRRQGKGTFVNARPMQRQLPELTSFSEHVHGLGLAPGSTLLSFETLAGDAPRSLSSLHAENEFSGQPLVMIERLRTVGEERVGIHRTLIPADVADVIGLSEHAASRPDYSLYASLHTSGVHLSSGEETLRAINADAHDAELLEVEEGIALIEVVRASRDPDGRLIEIVRARYLGTQYLYHISFAPTSLGENNEETTRTSGRTGGGLVAAERMRGRSS